jgi:hypothetical protein
MSALPIGIGFSLIFPLVYLGAVGLTVYWAVRLAIRHEQARNARTNR